MLTPSSLPELDRQTGAGVSSHLIFGLSIAIRSRFLRSISAALMIVAWGAAKNIYTSFLCLESSFQWWIDRLDVLTKQL